MFIYFNFDDLLKIGLINVYKYYHKTSNNIKKISRLIKNEFVIN